MEQGDVVQLKSGGPPMTLKGFAIVCTVIYWEGLQLREVEFPAGCLKPYAIQHDPTHPSNRPEERKDPPPPTWIPVTQQLPQPLQSVLTVCAEHGPTASIWYVEICELIPPAPPGCKDKQLLRRAGKWFGTRGALMQKEQHVTHWMALPEPKWSSAQ